MKTMTLIGILTAIVIVIAIGATLATMETPNWLKKTEKCSGNITLSAPEKAFEGDKFTLSISGLTECSNKIILVTEDDETVCEIKGIGSCDIIADKGTHTYTISIDMDGNGNLSSNELASAKIIVEEKCEGEIGLDIPGAATPGSDVTASVSGLIGCSGLRFQILLDEDVLCSGTISKGKGDCEFEAPEDIDGYTIVAQADINKDEDISGDESDSAVLDVSYVCSGTVNLNLSERTGPSAVVNATIYGVSNCDGTAYLKQNNCSGTSIGQCNIISNCTISFTTPNTTGIYTYYACFDINKDGNFSNNEYATKNTTVGCSGTLGLSLNPNPVEPIQNITAVVSGLSGCSGKIVNVTLGNTLACQINITAKNNCTFTAPNITGSYNVVAEIDQNGNNLVNETGEYKLEKLNVQHVLTFTEKRITTNTEDQMHPRIYEDIIVYDDQRNGNLDIYSYDLTSDTETQITTDNNTQWIPAIWGSKIVWEDNRNGNNDIYMWDGSESSIVTDNNSQNRPSIYEDKIVYYDDRNGNYDVYSYEGSESRITTDSENQLFPTIWDSNTAWSDDRNGNLDIYMYDGSEHRITTNSGNQSWPSIYEDKIVYQDDRNGNFDIYMWDGSAEIRITNDTHDQKQPYVYDNYIVWQDNRNGNWDIYVYEIDKGVTTRLTTNTANQTWPIIYGNKVVFQDERPGDYDIYMVTLS